MRRRKSDLTARVNGNLRLEFGDVTLTSYAGLELFGRYLRQSHFNQLIRQACADTPLGGDFGVVAMIRLLLALVVLGGRRLRHLAYLADDVAVQRFAGLRVIPTARTVQESNDDAVVFATALAFTGLMVAWGCAVWGTGYYYPPYVYYGPRPVYYPHYPTYGYAAAYNPWTGAYGRGAFAYGPYGGAGVGAKYNPTTGVYSRGVAAYGPYGGARAGQAYNSRTGTYARGAMTYGPYGAQGAAQAYNPRTGAYGETRQGSNVYGNWGSTTVQRGDDWAQTAHSTNYRTGSTTAAGRTSEGGAAVTRSGAAGNTSIARTGSGDIYAGHDGNVYRKSGDGYQKYENGSWNTVQPPTTEQKQQAKTQAQQAGAQARTQASTSGWSGQTASQVQRDASARTAGTERTQAYSGVRSGSAKPSSYRPSGSSRSGGGARRR